MVKLFTRSHIKLCWHWHSKGMSTFSQNSTMETFSFSGVAVIFLKNPTQLGLGAPGWLTWLLVVVGFQSFPATQFKFSFIFNSVN